MNIEAGSGIRSPMGTIKIKEKMGEIMQPNQAQQIAIDISLDALNFAEERRNLYDIASLELRKKLSDYELACLEFVEAFKILRMLSFLITDCPDSKLARRISAAKADLKLAQRLLKLQIEGEMEKPI
jgi:hypothetical protein